MGRVLVATYSREMEARLMAQRLVREGIPSTVEHTRAAYPQSAYIISHSIYVPEEYLAQASRDEELRGRLSRMYQAFSDQVSAIIEQGVREGTFRDVQPREAAGFIAAALDGLVLQKVGRPEMDLSGMWRAAEDVIMKGLLKK